ncbi:F0F1 ATP synthase subunit epsilon [Roseovarius sp. SCSIO 43702]|uniref:F0F1 ATP synthase subunit epsilon n=1 Tax=Roseovarius sp. SCSIO 43702 TaxID=2823043 RepID=UPI001C73D4ED|nr:F0F1 ATP synthase subunit epsilon [Roseovarius sp. SCSIO 43702]QYX57704.1 F0F1 ATP synthase subunit epsilon [Roseovarius sp. SCSIO 43702]
MAETVQFDLVSPERQLLSEEVREIRIPATEGDMTVMAGHTPVITGLRPGVLRVSGSDGDKDFIVTGGFAEINAESISVLAERAIPREDMTQDDMKKLVDEATDKLAKAQETFKNEPGPVDDAAKLLADMVAMGDEIDMPVSSKAAAP